MASSKPLTTGREEDKESADEQGTRGEDQPLTFEACKRAVQKYPSDNKALDREFRTAYPSTTLAEFMELSREDKITAVSEARLLINAGNFPAVMSVEGMRGGRGQDLFSSPHGEADDREHIPKRDLTPPPADAGLTQVLLYMQQQQRIEREEARREAEVAREEARREAEAAREEARRAYEAQKAATDAQIKLLAD